MSADTHPHEPPTAIRAELLAFARDARERRVEAEDGCSTRLAGQCHQNARQLAQILSGADLLHEVVGGVLVGDPETYTNAEYAYPSGDVAEEHGDERTPTVLSDEFLVVDTIPTEDVAESGIAHVWIEVDASAVSRWNDDRSWIVEPFAEMRGTHEYEPVATPIAPLDYVKVDGSTFDRAALDELCESERTGRIDPAVLPEW